MTVELVADLPVAIEAGCIANVADLRADIEKGCRETSARIVEALGIVRLGIVRTRLRLARMMAAVTMSPATTKPVPNRMSNPEPAGPGERKRAETSCSDPNGIRRE